MITSTRISESLKLKAVKQVLTVWYTFNQDIYDLLKSEIISLYSLPKLLYKPDMLACVKT